MLDVLRYLEQPINGFRWLHLRTPMASKREALWNERDPLAGGRSALPRGRDRRRL